MRLKRIDRILYFFVLVTILTGFSNFARAEDECKEWLARLVSVQGRVEAKRAGGSVWIELKFGQALCPGDMVRVQQNSRAALVFHNEAVMRLDQNTTVAFPEPEKGKTIDVSFISGIALFFSRFPFSLRIFTPFVNGNIEGTEFLVDVGPSETSIVVYEGKVRADNRSGTVVVGKGESTVARAGEPPIVKAVAHPADAVQWAMYYPPIPDADIEGALSAFGPESTVLKASLQAYRAGDLAGAFACLRNVPEVHEPAFYSYRALLYLSAGRVAEASSDLKKALEIDPGYGYAVSLQSIMAISWNKKDEALALARRAVSMNPRSAAPLVALSYAQQARFDLEGTLASLNKARDLNPKDALTWARLAEIWLSKGSLDKALDCASNAVIRNPELTRTQTVLGFAYLTQIRIEESKEAFKKAIELDQADPLPRLGLGLALIRGGDLKAGRAEIEVAAVLDPNNSLVRSYLGKAYYEEKRDKKAAEELSRAKEMDPLDPTPWFYDAIRKQTVNRPAEAIEDLQRSIELNDNRAVYRSRLLLDEDIAARSVALARIYEDLGFEWLSLIEGTKSLDRDPANFSAHRFLADAYFSLPRHDIARVSELLQSQLLQPLNLLPIQPQQAESNRFLLNGLGPRDPAYNEFTPLFTRNQLALLVGGSAGERGTISDSIVQSGIIGRLSYSLGQYHSETNGFRENNDQANNVYDAFAQFNLSSKTSFQAEFRHRDSNLGDLMLLSDPLLFLDPTLREKDWRRMYRFGFHHAFAPGSDLIGSFMRVDAKPELRSSFPFDFENRVDESGLGVEVQHLFRSELFRLVVGAGHFNIDEKDLTAFMGESSLSKYETNHTDVYAYSLWSFPKDVIWTVGFSVDFFDGGITGLDTQQPNPKFGVVWNPFPGTTLRGAAFRTLKRTLLTDQTVEPTHVAGFNQFFDDPEGTDAWRYGIGMDQKLTERFFAGVEFSIRDLDIPSLSYSVPVKVFQNDAREQLGRAYLYWIPHKYFAFGPEYQYELTKYDPNLPAFGISRLETHRLGFGISFFHPSGFIARVKPTLVFQDGEFRVNPGDPVFTGDSSFFVLDASIGYRLPGRLGLIEVVAKNLFDESFRFQDTDPRNPQITPRRFILGRWTFSF